MRARFCPECGESDTERVQSEWFVDSVQEVRLCTECPTEFVVRYADPIVTDVTVHE